MSYPMDVDPQPELDEVQQRSTSEPEDHRLICIIDEVRDPVRTQSLPARGAVMQSVTVSTALREVFGKDLRRARAVVWPLAEETAVQFFVGPRRDEVQQGTAAMMDTSAGPLELKNTEALYARTVSGDAVLSFLLEYWAD